MIIDLKNQIITIYEATFQWKPHEIEYLANIIVKYKKRKKGVFIYENRFLQGKASWGWFAK